MIITPKNRFVVDAVVFPVDTKIEQSTITTYTTIFSTKQTSLHGTSASLPFPDDREDIRAATSDLKIAQDNN